MFKLEEMEEIAEKQEKELLIQEADTYIDWSIKDLECIRQAIKSGDFIGIVLKEITVTTKQLEETRNVLRELQSKI